MSHRPKDRTWKAERHRQRVIRKSAKRQKQHRKGSGMGQFAARRHFLVQHHIQPKPEAPRSDLPPQTVFRRTVQSVKQLFRRPQSR